MFRAGYKDDCPPEYMRAFAARFWRVPPWSEELDSPYWVDLALACHNVEIDFENHLRNKSGD